MIRNSFIFLEKVGFQMEKNIWSQNILDWNAFLRASHIQGISRFRKRYYDRDMVKAEYHLRNGDFSYFLRRLPFSETYRLYPYFMQDFICIDIETGYSRYDVAVVGLHNGDSRHQLVQGKNLDSYSLKKILSGFSLIMTFNGSCFDLPILQRCFPGSIPKDIIHLDLRFLCSSLGYEGGLKSIEADLGLSRDYDRHLDMAPDISGTCIDPVHLWHLWKTTSDKRYLDLLLEYNNYDAENLHKIADIMYDKISERFNGNSIVK